MDPLVVAAQIAAIDAKLTSGVTHMQENGRLMKFDLAALRARRAELITQYNALVLGPPTIRRVLTTTLTKGL